MCALGQDGRTRVPERVASQEQAPGHIRRYMGREVVTMATHCLVFERNTHGVLRSKTKELSIYRRGNESFLYHTLSVL